MKHVTRSLPVRALAILLCCLFVIAIGSCKKNNNSTTTTTVTPPPANALVTYKNSSHHIYVGYLVGDGNDPFAAYDPANSPDSVDYLEFFAGYDTIQSDWRTAQAKGTKIVYCHSVKDAYFDGSVNDPATQVAGYVNPTGFNQTTAKTTSTYYHWASNVYNQIIVQQKLDGIDLDIESGTFGSEVPRTSANGDSLVVALAVYFGPNCTECATKNSAGKNPVFFYDTDGSSGLESTMYTPHRSNYDYVLFQSYTTGNHSWSGTGTASFPPLVSTYGIDKLIFLVNGDSYIYPNGSQDVAGGDSIATASLYSYAAWVKANNGVGVGSYRMSRDYNHTPQFADTKHAIQIMNPAQ